MDYVGTLAPVDAIEISTRGRIHSASSWHEAERRVNLLHQRSRSPGLALPPAWPTLLLSLGGDLMLANRSMGQLRPTVDAANRIIAALNALPASGTYVDLERLIEFPPPAPASDRMGEAMDRVRQGLETQRVLSARERRG